MTRATRALMVSASVIAVGACSGRSAPPQTPCVATVASTTGTNASPDPRVVADFAAMCEGDEKSGDRTFDPRIHDDKVDDWIRGALVTEAGKRVFATVRGGAGLVARGELLASEAARVGLTQCTLATELRRREHLLGEGVDVAKICAGAPSDAFPSGLAEPGKVLVGKLGSADDKVRGSLLRREAQRLALASCPRADAWDAARGLAVETDDKVHLAPVTATTAEFSYAKISSEAERVLEAAWPSIVACHQAALLADAPFEGTIAISFELGVPRLELKKGSVPARDLPRCLSAALTVPPRAYEMQAGAYLAFRTPDPRDTFTARPVSARVGFERITLLDVRTTPPAKGKPKMIGDGEPVFEPPIRKSAVRDALEHHARQLRACFEKARQGDPKIGAGTIEGQLIVDLEGAVESAKAVGGSLTQKDAQSCTLGVLRSLRFVELPNKALVSVTISFTPS